MPSVNRTSAALWVLFALAASVSSCGPSLRRVHTGNVYFERCSGGDRDARYTDAERRHCWDAWLTHYTDGQSDERISYARERVTHLDPERSALIEMATGEAELEAEVEAELATGEETAHLPPSEAPIVVLTGRVTGAETEREAREPRPPREVTPELRARHRPTRPRTSTAHCDGTCMPPWEACVDSCDDRDRACHGACRQRFRICSSGCY